MLKIAALIFFSFAVAGIASGQTESPTPRQAAANPTSETPAKDSLSSIDQPLLPLNLGSLGDTLESARPSLLPADRSWMAEPDTMRLAPFLDLLFEISHPVVSDSRSLPFRRESWLLQSRANLMSPWKLQMQSDEKYRIWRTIFGSIQAGGMAYLMYLHFKKYGLK